MKFEVEYMDDEHGFWVPDQDGSRSFDKIEDAITFSESKKSSNQDYRVVVVVYETGKE